MTHDLLHHLADVEIGTRTPDLASVERRSHAILRSRRAVRVGAIGLAAVATLAAGTILPLGSQRDTPTAQMQLPLGLGAVPAAATDEAACELAFTSAVDRTDWASTPGIVESAALIGDPPVPLTGIYVRHTDLNCPDAVPAAVLYDDDPVRGVSVWPDVQDPFAGIEDVPDEPPLGHVVVDGHEALLRDFGDETIQLTWFAADGTRWMAMSSGFSLADALSLLGTLSFDGFTLDVSSVPADLTVAEASSVPPTTSATEWSTVYGEEDAQPAVDPPTTTLSTTSSFTAPPEVAASMAADSTAFAEVDGAHAVYTTNGLDQALVTHGWLRWTRDGVRYTLVGPWTFDELVALAEKVEPVALDDSRVSAVPAR